MHWAFNVTLANAQQTYATYVYKNTSFSTSHAWCVIYVLKAPNNIELIHRWPETPFADIVKHEGNPWAEDTVFASEIPEI